MRVLLATDGSTSAKHAEELVAAVAWPAGTEIDALCIDQLVDRETDLSTQRFAEAHSTVRRLIDEHLSGLIQRLSGPGRMVQARVIFGRPASAIVSEAEQLDVDLIVIGSHNRGALASFTLGSVSAEVVDRAPCPVLVARRSLLGPIVLGHDGSVGARQAEELVATWPFLAAQTVRVVSASRLVPQWYVAAEASVGPAISGELLQELLDSEQAESRRVATEGAARLSERGVIASALPVLGTPVDGLLEAITATNAQLVIIGSRGNTGLTRVLLGSVARSILYQAPCSVLIVREKRPTGETRHTLVEVGANDRAWP